MHTDTNITAARRPRRAARARAQDDGGGRGARGALRGGWAHGRGVRSGDGAGLPVPVRLILFVVGVVEWESN